MKIAIYYSGCVRTLKHVVDHNIKVIRDNVGDCEIHTFYSFWDVTDKPVDFQMNGVEQLLANMVKKGIKINQIVQAMFILNINPKILFFLLNPRIKLKSCL